MLGKFQITNRLCGDYLLENSCKCVFESSQSQESRAHSAINLDFWVFNCLHRIYFSGTYLAT